MFYLVGLGLDLNSISKEAVEICRKVGKIYLETYTVDFPYKTHQLEEAIGNKIIPLTRIMVEGEEFVDEAKSKDIVLLVYGSPLTATTHISLILKCRKENIQYKVIHNASIFDAIGESGLQMYKFGKTASMPKWDKKHKPTSFVDIIKENRKINAHTLILVDIGLPFIDALKQLTKACGKTIKPGKMLVCSKLGTKDSKIVYDGVGNFHGEEVYPPFCFIIPGKLHFLEKESLESL